MASGSGRQQLPENWSVVPRCAQILRGHSGPVWGLALSSLGQVFSASYDGTVRIWRRSDGLCLRVVTPHAGPLWAVALSDNGRRLFTGSYDRHARSEAPRAR